MQNHNATDAQAAEEEGEEEEAEVLEASDDVQRQARFEAEAGPSGAKEKVLNMVSESEGTEDHESGAVDAFALMKTQSKELRKDRDDLKRKLKRFVKFGTAVGFDMSEDAFEEEIERAKKLKRVHNFVESNGGYDFFQRYFRNVDKRTKADYHAVILAPLDITPNDVVLIYWALPERCCSFGMVCIDPDPDSPREVHVELALQSEQGAVTACVPSRPSVVVLSSPRLLEDHLDKVFMADNIIALAKTNKLEDEDVYKFTRRLYQQSKRMILGKALELRGRCGVWAKAWEQRKDASWEGWLTGQPTNGAAPAPAGAPAPAPAPARVAAPTPAPASAPDAAARARAQVVREKVQSIVKLLVDDKYDFSIETDKEKRMARALGDFVTHLPDLRESMYQTLYRRDINRSEKLRLLRILVVHKCEQIKKDPASAATNKSRHGSIRPARKSFDAVVKMVKPDGTIAPLPQPMPCHGFKIKVQCAIPVLFDAAATDALFFRPWGVAQDKGSGYSWPFNDATYPNGHRRGTWYQQGRWGDSIQFEHTVYNPKTNIFRKGTPREDVRQLLDREHSVVAGDWLTGSNRTAVYQPRQPPGTYHVTFPANVQPGDTFHFFLNDSCCKLQEPKEGEPGYKLTVRMRVPEGKRAHCNMHHLHDDGSYYHVRIPGKMKEGDYFNQTIVLQKKGFGNPLADDNSIGKNCKELLALWAGDSVETLDRLSCKYESFMGELKDKINNKLNNGSRMEPRYWDTPLADVLKRYLDQEERERVAIPDAAVNALASLARGSESSN